MVLLVVTRAEIRSRMAGVGVNLWLVQRAKQTSWGSGGKFLVGAERGSRWGGVVVPTVSKPYLEKQEALAFRPLSAGAGRRRPWGRTKRLGQLDEQEEFLGRWDKTMQHADGVRLGVS